MSPINVDRSTSPGIGVFRCALTGAAALGVLFILCWAGAVISGQKSGSCSSGSHTAYEAPLLHELVVRSEDINTRQNNVIWRSICQNTFDTAVQDALSTFTIACLNIPPLPK